MKEWSAQECFEHDMSGFIGAWWEKAPTDEVIEAWDWISNPYINEERPPAFRRAQVVRYAGKALFWAWCADRHEGHKERAFLEILGVVGVPLESACYIV